MLSVLRSLPETSVSSKLQPPVHINVINTRSYTKLVNADWEGLCIPISQDPRWLPFQERIGKSPAQLDAIEFNVELLQKAVTFCSKSDRFWP